VARATAPNTAALAARTSGRLGIAARVGRIVPEVCSLVAVTTPRVPIRSRPTEMPARALLVRSPVAFSVLAPTATAMLAAAAIVTARVHQVERRLRSLTHSMRAACRNR
jgi:hypothetical protein